MRHVKFHPLSGYTGMILLLVALFLGLAGYDVLGWLALALGALLLTYSLYTGSRPFLRD